MRWHLHRWSPWRYLREYKWFAPYEGKYPAKVYRVFQRSCIVCGEPQTKKVQA